jgi:hypothetical protein
MHARLNARNRCTEELTARQLPNGGWPFARGTVQAAVEPTTLALLALPPNSIQARDAGIGFLLRTQNPNGSWPAFLGDDEGGGSGFTGLALFALRRCGIEGTATDRATRWLLRVRGRESDWLWRWKFRIFDRHTRFEPSKFGWPWMPGTVSWVVPTSYSLLALKSGNQHSRRAHHRIRRGVEMLYDRICPGGGWNAGNGVVYASALAAHPDTTAIALLALQGEAASEPITTSLDWLEQRAETCVAPWSLAWTILALDAYERPIRGLTERLAGWAESVEIDDCATLAVATLALACAGGLNPFEVHP